MKTPRRATLSPKAERVPHFLLDTGGRDFVSCGGGDLRTGVQPGVGAAGAGDAGRGAGVVAHGAVAAGMRVVGVALAERALEGDELSGGVGAAGAGGDDPRAARENLSRRAAGSAASPWAGAERPCGAPLGGVAAGGSGAGGQRREPHGAHLERVVGPLSSARRRTFVRSADALCHPQPHGGMVGRAGLQRGGLAGGGARPLDWLERGGAPGTLAAGDCQQPVLAAARLARAAFGLACFGAGAAPGGAGLAAALRL